MTADAAKGGDRCRKPTTPPDEMVSAMWHPP